jgi:hypothetical protein
VATARSAHGEPDGNGEPNGDGESDQLNSGPKHQGNYHQNPIDQTRAWISSNWSIVCVLTNQKLLANQVAWSHPIDKSDKLVNRVQQINAVLSEIDSGLEQSRVAEHPPEVGNSTVAAA